MGAAAGNACCASYQPMGTAAWNATRAAGDTARAECSLAWRAAQPANIPNHANGAGPL